MKKIRIKNSNLNLIADHEIREWIKNYRDFYNKRHVNVTFDLSWLWVKEKQISVPKLSIDIYNIKTQDNKSLEIIVNGKNITANVIRYDAENQVTKKPKKVIARLYISEKYNYDKISQEYIDLLIKNIELIYFREYIHSIYKINIKDDKDIEKLDKKIKNDDVDSSERQIINLTKQIMEPKEVLNEISSSLNKSEYVKELKSSLAFYLTNRAFTIPDEIVNELISFKENLIDNLSKASKRTGLKKISEDNCTESYIDTENGRFSCEFSIPHKRAFVKFKIYLNEKTGILEKIIEVTLFQQVTSGVKQYNNLEFTFSVKDIVDILLKEISNATEIGTKTDFLFNVSQASNDDIYDIILILYNLLKQNIK